MIDAAISLDYTRGNVILTSLRGNKFIWHCLC